MKTKAKLRQSYVELAEPADVREMLKLADAFDAGYDAAKPPWISVKDRLPEEGQRVLLYDPLQYVCIVLAHWYSTSSLPFFDHETLDGMHITIRLYDHKHIYWMPLPKPPKEI